MPSVQIHVNLNSRPHNTQWRPEKILNELVAAGWVWYRGHLPVGCANLNNWVYNSEEYSAVFNIFRTKHNLKEVNGVKLGWKDGDFGGNFLFWPEDNLKDFTLEISDNPQTIKLDDDYEIIDIQGYIDRLFPALDNNFGICTIESIHKG